MKIRTLGWRSKKKRRTELRYNGTKAEIILWNKLTSKSLGGLKFRCQHGIGPFIVDFYHPESMTVIEIDGSIHDQTEVQESDKLRTDYLMKRGYKIIRFRNQEIYNNIDEVLKTIVVSVMI